MVHLFLACVYSVDSNNVFHVSTNAACFLILHIVVSFSILAAKMNFRLHSYTISKSESNISFLLTDLQKCALSFMLFWTLFFGLLYLF
jgi:membrane protein YdbS with pleckstrin-like domain